MAAGEKKLSQLTQRTVFPSDTLIYGTSTGTSYAFGLQAMQNLIRYSSSVANLFTTPLNLTRSGQNIIVPADRTWNIFGEEFTNPSSVTRNVPFAAAGKTRIDLLVANQSNTFVLVTGTEVDLPAAPSAPAVPFMTLEATFLIVTDDSVSDPGEPSAPIYIGDYDSEAMFLGSIPRPYKGYFAFVKNLGGQFIYKYNGTDWEVNLIGPAPTYFEQIPNNAFITIGLERRFTDNYYDTSNVGTGGVFLDKTIIFPENSTIPFQAGYVEVNDPPTNVTLLPYRFTTDAYVFYQGEIITDITIQPEDVCTLKWGGYADSTDGIQIWFLTVLNNTGTGTVTSVMGDLVDNTDPLNPVVNVPTLQEITDNEGGASETTGSIQVLALIATNGVQGSEVGAIDGNDSVILRPQGLSVDFQRGEKQGQLNANGIDDNYSWELPNQSGTIAMQSDLDFTRRLITKGTGSVTGTVSETILTTLTIPANTLDSSCFIWTTMDFFKTNSGAVTARLYVNNANTLTGATLLGYSTTGSNRNVSFNRKFLVTGTSLDLLTANTASTQVTNEFIENLYGASTVLTINPSADIFLIYTTQNDATGTVATNKMATVQKMKL